MNQTKDVGPACWPFLLLTFAISRWGIGGRLSGLSKAA
jgi:hypothetical protein